MSYENKKYDVKKYNKKYYLNKGVEYHKKLYNDNTEEYNKKQKEKYNKNKVITLLKMKQKYILKKEFLRLSNILI